MRMSCYNRLEIHWDRQKSTGLKLDSLYWKWINNYKYHQMWYPGRGIDSFQVILSPKARPKLPKSYDTYAGSLVYNKCSTATELSDDVAAVSGRRISWKTIRYHPYNARKTDHFGSRCILVWGGIMLGTLTPLQVF